MKKTFIHVSRMVVLQLLCVIVFALSGCAITNNKSVDTSSAASPSDYPVGKYDGYSLKEAGLMIDEEMLKEVFEDKAFYIHQNAANGADYGAPLNADNLQGTFTQLCALQAVECVRFDLEYINFTTLQAYKRTDLESGVLFANYKPYTAQELEPYIAYTNDTYIVYDMLPLLVDMDIDEYIRYQCKHKNGDLDCDCLPETAVDWIISMREKVLATDGLITKA